LDGAAPRDYPGRLEEHMSDWNNEGLYSFPGDRRAARIRFLGVLGSRTNALASLQELVFPSFQQCVSSVSVHSGWQGLTKWAEKDTAASEFLKAALQWSEKFHLKDEWLLDSMIHTLYRCGTLNTLWQFHYDNRDERNHRQEDGTRLFQRIPDEFAFSFGHDEIVWMPDDFSEKDFEAFLDEQWALAKQAFFVQARQKLEALGAVKVKAKRNRQGSPLAHFEWLVQFQVLGLSIAEITERAGLSDDTVPKALSRVAQEIGLTLHEEVKRQYPKPENEAPHV
jgi:DNA-directed RNA polymerase specialized sigma24 family protein